MLTTVNKMMNKKNVSLVLEYTVFIHNSTNLLYARSIKIITIFAYM